MDLIIDILSNKDYFILIDKETNKEYIRINKRSNTIESIKAFFGESIKIIK